MSILNYIIIFLILYLIIKAYYFIKGSDDNSNQQTSDTNQSYTYEIKYTPTDYASFDLDYYNFDKKYYNKITNMLDKYENFCENTAEFFCSHFSVNQRITRLEKCIEKLDTIKTTFWAYGDIGKRFYNEITSEEYKEIYATWSKDDIIVNRNGDDYEFEFNNIDFYNYNFLTYLLELYKSDTKNQQKHLNQEKQYYTISDYGGTEEYQEMLEYKAYYASLKSNTINILKENKTILQSELLKKFAENDKTEVRKVLKELLDNNTISKEKSGRSYLITYLK